MNKFNLILFLVLTVLNCKAQIINFTDLNFKNKLLLASTSNNMALDFQNQSMVIDSNNNGEIEISEANAVFSLSVPQANITSLSGIEHFTNLKRLQVSANFLTSLDVSVLTNLEYLFCNNNQINTINFGTSLKVLSCDFNNISSFNLTGMTNLESVFCKSNLITALDFSNCPSFTTLICQNNPNLTSIKIKNGTQQVFNSHPAFYECWSGLPNLTYVCADDFEITDLQNYLLYCNVNQPITIDSNCVLNISDFETANFSIYPNPSNGLFTVDFGNSIETANLMIYNMLGQEVYSENIKNATNKTINLEHLSKGTYVLKYVENSLVESRKILIK